MAKKMKVRSRSRGHNDDDDADYDSRYTSRTTDKKRRSSSSTRSAPNTRKSRSLAGQDLQELGHLDLKQPTEPPLTVLRPKHSSHDAPVSYSETFLKTALPSLSSIPSCSP
ncbi:unnamed protein product [Mortierella alpina]